MQLTPGTRLGAYEVVGSLGAGGMGEVYQARDTRLKRDVALKILPESFASDPDRLARFEREAELLASLNHPHIAAIYGVEDSGPVHALVLELVAGETLADRIARGPIPSHEALPLALQIATAVGAAHEQGIVHRDLKPSNIKVTGEGVVKVLDFGLAKLTDRAASVERHGPVSSHPLSVSPTMMSPVMATGIGVVVGTAAYMAPEQAKGQPVDKRTDVWAFGCVLFEMLTGRRAFEGDDVSDTLATILKGEPAWAALPQDLPLVVRTLVQRCLEKDRARRVGDLSAARFVLEEVVHPGASASWPSTGAATAAGTNAPGARGVWLGLAGALLLSGMTAAAVWYAARPPAPRVSRFELAPSNSMPLSAPAGVNVAVSPEGGAIVFHAQAGGVERLVVRHIGDLDASAIPGTEFASNPFFSPDGTRLGFVTGAQLRTIPLGGGAPTTVCEVSGEVLGATWEGDTIVFAESGSGLFRVPAAGGKPELIVAPDPQAKETDLRWPLLLPGGRALLYNVYGAGGARDARIVARRLDTGATTLLVEGGNSPRYAGGYLIYSVVPETLMAVVFDAESLQLRATPVPVMDGINSKATGAVSLGVAQDGTFVYARRAGSVFQSRLRFQWMSRDGTPLAVVASDVVGPRYPRLSPDGRSLAVTIGASNQGHVWVIDLTGASQPRQLTFRGHNVMPTWSADGKYLAFSSDRDGQRNIFRVDADGSVLEPVRLVGGPLSQSPGAWSPDGEWLLYVENGTKTRRDLMLLSAKGESRPWLQTEFGEYDPSFSPDGRWVSYVSDQTGRDEIWVRPFPGPGAPIRVSPDGGHEPTWSRRGDELFYQSVRRMMAVGVTAREPELRFATPRVLFEGGFVAHDPNVPRTYDVAADGRFLVIEEAAGVAPPTLVVVQNWFEDLRRLVPGGDTSRRP